MQRSRLSTGNRLRFDNTLSTRIREDTGPARLRPLRGVLVLTALIIALAWGITHVLRMPSRPAQAERLAATARTILEAMKSGQLDEALAVCADSETGHALIDAENKQTLKDTVASAATRDPGPVSCRAFLTQIRDELARAGVAWDQIRPLAFGGIQAKVQDPSTMKEYAECVTGAIYFASGETVYALELTARPCTDSYVVTDFWQCVPANVAPDGVQRHSADHFRAFKQDPAIPEDRTRIKASRAVFLPL